MLTFASKVLYYTVLVPISIVRRLRGSSPFGRRAHLAPSAWDPPAGRGRGRARALRAASRG